MRQNEVSLGESDRKPRWERYGALWVALSALAMVLLIYVAVFSVIIEFAYRHLVTAPVSRLVAWLVRRKQEPGQE